MILHIPHSSTKIDGLVELQNEKQNIDYLTDTYVVELFSENEYTDIVFPYSRFVCDVERLVDDPMQDKGQGIIYTKDIFGSEIKRNIIDGRTMLMYDKHHKKLNLMVNKYLTLFHKCVIIDCHSFTPTVTDEVDFCIGTDVFHTPKKLARIVGNSLVEKGYRYIKDMPYSGTIIPSQHYMNGNVDSIMIEVNKNVYMNGNFAKVRQDIQSLLKEIEKYEDEIGE